MIETNLNLPVLIGAAVIDSINPCAIGVLVFLLAYVTKVAKRPRDILKHGLVYLFAVFITYLLAGVLLLPIIQSLGNFSVNAYIGIALVIAIFGVYELKEYFRPGGTNMVGIPPRYAKKIKESQEKIMGNIFTTFGLGVFVAIVELPCTGAVYLAVLALMSMSGVTMGNITLLILYNFIFIFPLIIIVFLFYRGFSSEKLQSVVEKYKPFMRLLTGILLIGLAAWMAWFIGAFDILGHMITGGEAPTQVISEGTNADVRLETGE